MALNPTQKNESNMDDSQEGITGKFVSYDSISEDQSVVNIDGNNE